MGLERMDKMGKAGFNSKKAGLRRRALQCVLAFVLCLALAVLLGLFRLGFGFGLILFPLFKIIAIGCIAAGVLLFIFGDGSASGESGRASCGTVSEADDAIYEVSLTGAADDSAARQHQAFMQQVQQQEFERQNLEFMQQAQRDLDEHMRIHEDCVREAQWVHDEHVSIHEGFAQGAQHNYGEQTHYYEDFVQQQIQNDNSYQSYGSQDFGSSMNFGGSAWF